ncbi:MAG: hypothetical protein AAB728_05315 [Patescibacteria group bacterium]
MEGHPESNGRWKKRVAAIARKAEKLVTRGERELQEGGLSPAMRDLLFATRDQLNDIFGEWEEESGGSDDYDQVEESLGELYGRFRSLLEEPRKPEVKARRRGHQTHRYGETQQGGITNVWNYY